MEAQARPPYPRIPSIMTALHCKIHAYTGTYDLYRAILSATTLLTHTNMFSAMELGHTDIVVHSRVVS